MAIVTTIFLGFKSVRNKKCLAKRQEETKMAILWIPVPLGINKSRFIRVGPLCLLTAVFYFDVLTINTYSVAIIIHGRVLKSQRIIIYLHRVWCAWFAWSSKLPMRLSKALMIGYLLFNYILKGYFILYCPPTATFY